MYSQYVHVHILLTAAYFWPLLATYTMKSCNMFSVLGNTQKHFPKTFSF